LEAATRMQPDVILSDIGMPGMDGFEFIQRLKRTALTAVPVIAMTGYTREQDVKRALAHGFAAHLAKPVDPSKMERLIQDLLRDNKSK
jgi:two-component system CheB/CheR fusion protein